MHTPTRLAVVRIFPVLCSMCPQKRHNCGSLVYRGMSVILTTTVIQIVTSRFVIGTASVHISAWKQAIQIRDFPHSLQTRYDYITRPLQFVVKMFSYHLMT
jgi:hypothetical protein